MAEPESAQRDDDATARRGVAAAGARAAGGEVARDRRRTAAGSAGAPTPGSPIPGSSTGTGRGLRPPALSPWARAGLLTLGAVLIAIGVAGLVLPGIQGLVTIVAGLVVVSLGSHSAHRWTRRGLRRWPFALDKYEKMRRSLRRRFRRRR